MPTVLIVEDDAPLRHLTASIVVDLGFRPLTASGPGEALELARRDGFDILMTDLDMGGNQRTEVLPKPYRMAQLVAVLDGALGGRN